jgi:hypothetical protein
MTALDFVSRFSIGPKYGHQFPTAPNISLDFPKILRDKKQNAPQMGILMHVALIALDVLYIVAHTLP